MVRKQESEVGKFECVLAEPGKAPSVGKLHVYKTSAVFKAEMFGLDNTTVSVKRRDLTHLDATQTLKLSVVYKDGKKKLDLQFTSTKAPFRCIVDAWKLAESDAKPMFAVPLQKEDKNAKKDYGKGVEGIVNMVKDKALTSYESANEKLKKVMREATKAGAKIPPTPKLPLIECEEVVSKCLFVKVHRAENLLAMDAGDTSDPFVVVRYRGLEATSSTIQKSLNPEFNEVFHFRTPPGKVELDDDDKVEIIVYDRDFGGLNDFIGYAKVDMEGVRVDEGAGRPPYVNKPKKIRQWHDLEPLPKDQKGDFFDMNHMKEKLMFWEGERGITGRVFVETWVGNRHDEEFRVAGVPVLKVPEPEAEKRVSHSVDPVTALLRVEVKRGRKIMNLDDDGGSDPYCEVAVVDPKGVRPEQTQATHYIDDATDPEWDRAFNFICAKPYVDHLVLRVYDYDGATSFDDLIGMAKIPIHELDVYRGTKRPPDERWITLVDKEGNEANKDGEVYGDVCVRAYLDEEYFEHLHGGNATAEVGRMTVDVMRATDLPNPTTTFAVVKMGPYWTRLPSVADSAKPVWKQRLRYPVFEPAEKCTVALFEGTASSCKFLGRVKLQLSTMEDKVRYAGSFQLMARDPSSGEIKKTCKLECGMQFNYKNGGSLVARKYLEPTLPDKWYFSPMSDEEKERMIKAHKEMVVERMKHSSPPMNETVSKELLEFAKHEVNVASIKSSIARIQRLTAGFDQIGAGLTFALSWQSIPATALTQCYIVYLIYYPNMFMPSLLCLVALYSLALFPSRYGRVLSRMEADEWLSQGLPFPPPTEEEERRKKEAEEERKRKEEEEQEAAKKAEEEEKKLAALEGDADKSRGDREKKLEEKKKKREAEEKKRKEAEERAAAPKEAFNWESINPLASLQKQMDEIYAMITMSQNILDEAASCAERVAGVLSWEEPRVTAGVLVVILALAWALVYVEVVTRFFIKIVLGVVVKTIFKIVSPATIKFGVSCGVLFALRHPAILPDEQTRIQMEARKRAEREAALAKEAALEAAGVDDDDEEEEAAAAVTAPPPPAPSAILDPRPLPPLNVFFRMPTQSDRLL